MVSKADRFAPWLVAATVALAASPASGQSNLDAGKSPAQIFSDTCAACHRSPREIKPSNVGFLRDHYSTGGREAAAMAAYLSAVGSDPRAVQTRRPPAMGAGQAAAPAESAAPGVTGRLERAAGAGSDSASSRPSIKPRRPSDSLEVGRLPVAGDPEAEPSPTAVAAPQHPLQQFEE